MKKVVAYFLLLFTACSPSLENHHTNKTLTDSVNKANQAIALFRDSLVNAEQDKAIGDMRFNISSDDFERAKSSFMRKCKLKDYEYYKQAMIINYKIGGYGFSSIDGVFYNDSLYMVILNGCYLKYDEYDRVMPSQYMSIKEILEKKFGEADEYWGLPNWAILNKGFSRKCAVWNIGIRTIEIWVTSHGIDYTLDLISFIPKVKNRVEEIRKNEKKIESEKGATAL